MLVERVNNEVVIKINSDVLAIKEFQKLMDYLRYLEISKKSKAKVSDLTNIVKFIKTKRKI